jgi:NAD(P)-dependent dehydrogenase (short-subunit alcohol dehydrogenase family)
MKKNVLITGASSGIGYSLAKHLQSNNWNVIGVYSGQSEFNKIDGVTWLNCDLSSNEQYLELITQVQSLYKNMSLDLLIHSAGLHKHDSGLDFSEYERIIRINFLIPFLITQCFSKSLLIKSSQVFFISSSASRKANPGQEFYGATKAALNSLVSSLAFKYAPAGISVVGFEPTLVSTKMSKDLFENQEAIIDLSRKTTQNNFASADDIAKLISSFANIETMMFTGQIITLDSGSLIGYGDYIWDEKGNKLPGFL